MAIILQFRRGTSQEWTARNPRLMPGEVGLETNTNLFKIGNGTDDWNTLPYAQRGMTGIGLQFQWNGTSLGVKREDEPDYAYVNLKGAPGVDGVDGIDGLDGKNLQFQWDGTSLGVRKEGDQDYTYTNLKGADGLNGTDGADGIGLQFQWNGTQLGMKREGDTDYSFVNLKGDKGDTGDKGDAGLTLQDIIAITLIYG